MISSLLEVIVKSTVKQVKLYLTPCVQNTVSACINIKTVMKEILYIDYTVSPVFNKYNTKHSIVRVASGYLIGEHSSEQ